MRIIETITGNIHEAVWETRLQNATVDWVALDQWEAQKSRLRKQSEHGADLAISLPRGVFLRHGDILVWDESANTGIVARVNLKEVMVIELAAISTQAPEVVVRTCVELGHTLGNQHWPAIIKGNRILVPLTVDKRVMASVMKTHAFRDITFNFISGDEIIPYLVPHEARRLFGGAEGLVHSHPEDHHHDYVHSPGDVH